MRTFPEKSIKRQSVSIQTNDLVKFDTLDKENLLPLIVSPNISEIDFREWLIDQNKTINEKLYEYGGILFRGFPVSTLEEFHHILEALDIPLMNYVEGATPRTALTDKVYTATNFPNEYRIQLHNELSYVLSWPMKVCFFCETPAEEGGETIIADMRRVHDRIPAEIREEFQRRKWKLIRNYNPNFSLTWQKSFGLSTREELADYCRRADLEFRWKVGGVLQTSCVREPIRTHPVTGDKLWFNHVAFWHPSMLDARIKEGFLENFKDEDLPYNTTFGDGGIITDEIIKVIQDAYDQETIAEPWQKGDILLLDNMLTAHGRNPFKGKRNTLVAMGGAYNSEQNA